MTLFAPLNFVGDSVRDFAMQTALLHRIAVDQSEHACFEA